MTLVVLGHGSQLAFQVSDRRLTRGDGTVFDDESNKLTIYDAPATRLIFGFTGLAECGSFRMREWLPAALRDATPSDYDPNEMLRHLASSLTTVFASHRDLRSVPGAYTRTTIACNGYLDTLGGPVAVYAFLTNYQNFPAGTDEPEAWSDFRVHSGVAKAPNLPLTSIQRIGLWQLYGEKEIIEAKEVLARQASADGIVQKISSQIRQIASDFKSSNAVGAQLMSAWIYSDRSLAPGFAYLPDAATFEYHAPAIVSATGVIFRDGRLTTAEEVGSPLVVPKQRRNARCACGSGKKYKRCHGR